MAFTLIDPYERNPLHGRNKQPQGMSLPYPTMFVAFIHHLGIKNESNKDFYTLAYNSNLKSFCTSEGTSWYFSDYEHCEASGSMYGTKKIQRILVSGIKVIWGITSLANQSKTIFDNPNLILGIPYLRLFNIQGIHKHVLIISQNLSIFYCHNFVVCVRVCIIFPPC